MGQIQSEEIPCPFCGKGRILCDHIPSVYSVKRTTVGSNRSSTPHKSPEIWEVKSDCSECGKSAKEIQKTMKEGVPVDIGKAKKRYNEIMQLREEVKKAEDYINGLG